MSERVRPFAVQGGGGVPAAAVAEGGAVPEKGAEGGAARVQPAEEGPLVLDDGGAILQEAPDARDPVLSVGREYGQSSVYERAAKAVPAALLPHDYRARGIDPKQYRYIVLSDLIWIRPNERVPRRRAAAQ